MAFYDLPVLQILPTGKVSYSKRWNKQIGYVIIMFGIYLIHVYY